MNYLAEVISYLGLFLAMNVLLIGYHNSLYTCLVVNYLAEVIGYLGLFLAMNVLLRLSQFFLPA